MGYMKKQHTDSLYNYSQQTEDHEELSDEFLSFIIEDIIVMWADQPSLG